MKMKSGVKSIKMDRIVHNSGLIKQELLILKPFIKEPWKEFTLTEIKAITKNKSHHYVFEALKKFAKLNLITEKKKGNTNIYAISPEDSKEKMKTFHMKHDEDMRFNCKVCNVKISAHNKDWHAGMCDKCFNKEFFPENEGK